MNNESKDTFTPQSNGYEYDCESYPGTDEESIDRMFPGWRDQAKAPQSQQPSQQPA